MRVMGPDPRREHNCTDIGFARSRGNIDNQIPIFWYVFCDALYIPLQQITQVFDMPIVGKWCLRFEYFPRSLEKYVV